MLIDSDAEILFEQFKVYYTHINFFKYKEFSVKENSKILSQEDFGHVLGNASRFSSTHPNLLLTAEKEKCAVTTYKFMLKAEKLF